VKTEVLKTATTGAFGLLMVIGAYGAAASAGAALDSYAPIRTEAAPLNGTGYAALTPARLLDTRPGFTTIDGVALGSGPIGPGETLTLKVTGRGGVPATGVDAVVLNVTAAEQTLPSFLTVFPTGSPRPATSNINPTPGIITPNTVIAKVGNNGEVSIYNNSGAVQVVADVHGWFPSGSAYTALVPARLMDTRPGTSTIDGLALGAGVIPAGGSVDLKVTGRGNVPATGVDAVVLNVTVVDQTSSSFITVHPAGSPRPTASNLNPTPGVIATNVVVANVGTNGEISIYNNSGTTNVVVDVQGWFSQSPAFTPVGPARLVDTRAGSTTIDGIDAGGGALGPSDVRTIKVTGRAGLPATGVGAVAINITSVDQNHSSFLTVFPTGEPRPTASVLNPTPGLVASNLVIARVGATGEISIYNNHGSLDVVVDIAGWFPSDVRAVDDTSTIDEDSGATAIDILGNDDDLDGGALTIASATQPANGTVVLTGGAAGARIGLTYEPNPNYCNTPPGTSPDTFTYTLNGGVTATVMVTVTCIDDSPHAELDGATVGEDAPATLIPVFANDTDIDGGPMQVQSVTQPVNGTVAITGGGSGLTYVPHADFCGMDTFTYTLNGDSTATVRIVVTCVNDAPVLTVTAAPLAYVEGAGAVAVDSGLTITDDGLIGGASVRITSNFVAADDDLAFVNQFGITGTYDGTTGTLGLNGTTTVANYQTALRSVTYINSSDNPSTATRTVSFLVGDNGLALSNAATRDITVAAANDAPAVATSVGATGYVEQASAIAVDAALTVSDVDDVDLAGAVVAVTTGFDAGDELVFTNQSGITGNYVSGTGVLTLTGTAAVSDFQTALRSITFRNLTNNNPSTAKAVTFTANDGTSDSNAATKNVAVTPVNDGPVLTTTSSALGYTENAGPVAIDIGVTVTDSESDQITGATVQVTGNFVSAQDDLGFANTAQITGSYNDTTGTLTLTGTTTLANYQAALRAVTYVNISDNPSTAMRTVSLQVTDAGTPSAASNVATRDITVAAVNDAPAVSTSVGAAAFTEDSPAEVVDNLLTVGDIDDTNIDSASVAVTTGFQAGTDFLFFTNQSGITGSYSSVTGVLTLTGSSTVANYQAALRTIAFRADSNDPPASKTIVFTVNDGDTDSSSSTKAIAITAVNDAPVNTVPAPISASLDGSTLSSTDWATDVTGISIADPDSHGNSERVTVHVVSGALTVRTDVAGGLTPAAIQSGNGTNTVVILASSAEINTTFAASNGIHYSVDPSPGLSDTFTITTNDQGNTGTGGARSDTDNLLILFNQPPVVTTNAVGTTGFTEGGPATAIDAALTVSDGDDTNLVTATIDISAGFQTGDTLAFSNQNGISGSYNSGTGVLTLTGSSTVANYQAALRSVTFSTGNDDPTTSRTVRFVINDASDTSAPATRGITITPVNDAPTLTPSGSTPTYTEDGSAVVVDGGITLADPDNTDIVSGQVRISANLQGGDALHFTNQNGITGSFNSGTAVLTLTGTATKAAYQTALRSITYDSTENAPPTSKTVEFKVNDGDADSNLALKTISITPVNDAPVVVASIGTTANTENAASTIDLGVTVTDIDEVNLNSGVVAISAGLQAGDSLNFTNQSGISGSYNSGTGVLTLTGVATYVDYQNALRSIQFSTSNDNPTASRTVSFTVNDGDSNSNTASKAITITAVEDAPSVTTTGIALGYTENQGATAIDPALNISDPDSTQMSGATVAVTTNFSSAQDDLGFTNQNGITGTYNDTTGVLTLSGTTSIANYDAALRTVTYQNVGDNPTPASRQISFQVTDNGAVASITASRMIIITSVNDAPVNTVPVGQTATEDTVLTFNAANSNPITVADLDAGSSPIVVTVSALHGTITPAGGSGAVVTGSGTGSSQITGTLTQVNLALNGLGYQGTSNYNVSRGAETITVLTNDQGNTGTGGALTDSDTIAVTVNAVNDAPIATAQAFGVATNMQRSITVSLSGVGGPTDPDTGDVGYTATYALTSITLPGAGCTGCVLSNVDLAAGTFDFDPPAGQTGAFTVNYTVNDSGNPAPEAGSASGTLTMNVAGTVIWFVDPSAAVNGTGTLAHPFQALSGTVGVNNDVEDVDAAAHRVFIYSNGTASGALALNSSEWLIGQAANPGVSFDSFFTLGTLPTGTIARPALNSGTTTIDGTITVAGGAKLQGLAISSGTATGLAGSSGTGIDVSQTSVTTTTGTAVTLNSAQGTYSLTGVTSNGAANGIVLDAMGTSSVTIAGGSIAGATTRGIDINSGTGDFTYNGTVATTATGRSIEVTNHTGGTVAFGGAITDPGLGISLASNAGATFNFWGALDIDSTTNTGFSAISSGTVTTGFTTNTIDTTTGTGFVFTNTNTNATQRINFTHIITVAGVVADISNSTNTKSLGQVVRSVGGGIGLNLDNAGSINTGGSGPSSLTSSTASAIVINASTLQALGTGLDVNTTSGSGVSVTGGTVAIFGGLRIVTTSGTGLNATAGGSIVVTGSSATIATTTGTALNIVNTTIGASDVTFTSISSNGGVNGIVLTNTGALGGLVVTGDFGSTRNSSGGTIQNKTGAAVLLNNTRDVVVEQMNLLSTGGSGVQGTSVVNFSFTNSTFTANGNSDFESAIAFNDSDNNFATASSNGLGNNIAGTLTVTGNSVTNAFYSGLDVQSDNGTVSNAVVSSNTFTNPGFSGVNLVGTGNASTSFGLTKATIANNSVSSTGGNGIQVSIGNSNTGGPGATAGVFNSATDMVSITGNAVSVDDTGTQAITVANSGGNSGSRTQTNFLVQNNGTAGAPLTGSDIGTVVLIGNNGFSDMSGTVNNNYIDANHTPGLGGGNGIGGGNGVAGAGNGWTPRLNLTVSNNTITDTDGNGILLVGRGTAGQADIAITGNNVAAPINAGGSARPGIRVDAGNASSLDDAICLSISGNTSAGSNGSVGIGVRKEGSASMFTNDFGLVGITSNPSTAQVVAFVGAQNPAGSGALVINGDLFSSCTFSAP
jgi:hypothetical protein